MSRHATAQSLSRYLDEDLGPAAEDRLESHLNECAECRERLTSLRHVASDLASLTRLSPPAILGRELRRRVRGESRVESWLETFERTLRDWSVQANTMPLFATLVAMAIMVVVLSNGTAEREYRSESGSGAGAAAEPSAASPSIRKLVRDRIFEREGELWVEEGTAGHPAERIDLRNRDAPPDLETWSIVGDTVRMLHDGRTIDVVFR